MMESSVPYIIALAMVVIGLLLVKKIAGCVFKAVVIFILFGALSALYYYSKSKGLV